MLKLYLSSKKENKTRNVWQWNQMLENLNRTLCPSNIFQVKEVQRITKLFRQTLLYLYKSLDSCELRHYFCMIVIRINCIQLFKVLMCKYWSCIFYYLFALDTYWPDLKLTSKPANRSPAAFSNSRSLGIGCPFSSLASTNSDKKSFTFSANNAIHSIY